MEKRNADGLTEKEFLEQYCPGDYDRPSVSVDMMILAMDNSLGSLRTLLVQRRNHPYIDCWALPGGFVGIDESAYEAACRELEEETGLKDIYLEQIYTMSQPDRDPRMRVIDIAYMALVPLKNVESMVRAGDDAKDALWFDIRMTEKSLIFRNEERGIHIEYSLKKKVFKNGVIKVKNYVPEAVGEEKLAFDHAQIILEGLMRLRNKAEYSDVVFNLMAKEFTLPDLQRVYEIILGKKLYKANFRDKIVDKVMLLDKKGISITGRKSSALYRYNGGLV
ncbi:MAG: NUDIX domain-containing protein [[Bacteroides] pectinophilus]|nr:NUDIX domain-containing protein [[Bacteroides] pectinophilus]